MAQVMSRGRVKSRFIIIWAIRSQVPNVYLVWYAVHRLNGGKYYIKYNA